MVQYSWPVYRDNGVLLLHKYNNTSIYFITLPQTVQELD